MCELAAGRVEVVGSDAVRDEVDVVDAGFPLVHEGATCSPRARSGGYAAGRKRRVALRAS